jgi:uncharacterized FlaG/YvyC family protein
MIGMSSSGISNIFGINDFNRPEFRAEQTGQTPNRPKNDEEKKEEIAAGLTPQQLEDTVGKINKAVNIFDLNIEYKLKYHEETKQQIVQVVKDDKVITEFPPEKLLDALAKIREDILGLVVDEKV